MIKYNAKAQQLNDLTFNFYYHKLKMFVLALFKYENLPNNINERWIEKYLYRDGKCMFFKHNIINEIITGVNEEGINHYEEAIKLRPVATNFNDTGLYTNGIDAVLIQNDDEGIPSDEYVRLFAWRLTNITRSQDVNINAQKTPILIVCSDKQRLTLKNVYSQYEGNEPVIFGDKSGDFGNITAIKTDAPIVFDKLQLQKHQVINEFLTFFGVNNANQDKKERLVANETEANNDEVFIFGESMLKARESACNQINNIFGTNIKVSRRIDLKLNLEGMFEDSDNREVI